MNRTINRSGFLLFGSVVLGFVVLVSLGVWQVQRLAWKEALIARVEARLDADPVAPPAPDEWGRLDLAGVEYRPVRVSGRYLNDLEVHVVHTLIDPKGPVGGIGYMVLTPFVTSDGWIVYVNRGFVPRERKDSATRPEGQVEGTTAVVGLLRQPYEPAWFSPGDDPAANQWFSRDPAAFIAQGDLPDTPVAPYLIDVFAEPAPPGGLPQGGETLVRFTNNHLQYALTWFGLAAALVAVTIAYAARSGRPPRRN